MAYIILAGEEGEDLGDVSRALLRHSDKVITISCDLTDPQFPKELGDRNTGVVISRFHEADLASIKAMQLLRISHPSLRFIFVVEKELPYSIITLMFNEGAYGILHEPFIVESTSQLIKQAVKRSEYDFNESVKAVDLKKINDELTKRIERLELDQSRLVEVRNRLERLVYFLFSEKTFTTDKVKILLVSDSLFQRTTMSDIFAQLHFCIEAVENAENALEIMPQFKPDIIVSDLEMPGMGGVELAKKIKESSSFSHVYFVIFTASEDKVDYVLSPETRVDECIVKPKDSNNYHDVVARVATGILTL